MKVIIAGLNKTGTMSIVAALKQLQGIHVVYHFMEQYENQGDDWRRICDNGGTIKDFHSMFSNVDAVADVPAAYFWEELLESFPDAKIILTVRDNEDDWFNSVKKQQSTFDIPAITLMRIFSPSYRKFYHYSGMIATAIYGTVKNNPFQQGSTNELLCKMTYRRHNTYVMEKGPKDKLLIYNVKEGWEPLCSFLNVPVPPTPFPHKNIRGSITAELLAVNPLLVRMQREMYFFIALSTFLCISASFRCVRKFFVTKLSSFVRCLPSY